MVGVRVLVGVGVIVLVGSGWKGVSVADGVSVGGLLAAGEVSDGAKLARASSNLKSRL